jgi:hypothetical protein
MIRAVILPLVLLFPAPTMFAQQSVPPHNTKSTVLTLPRNPEASCPVGMQARHGAGIPVGMIVGPSIDGSPIAPNSPAFTHARAQRIHLTMTNLLSREIVSAQFVVHGYSNKGRAMNLANSSPEPDLAKTVDVVLDVKGKGEASSDLSLSRFTAVTSIDVNSITYADGNTWHTPSPEACGVTPDLIMLVASTQ